MHTAALMIATYRRWVAQRIWLDSEGVSWRRRGQAGRDLGRRKIEKLLGDPGVVVVVDDYDSVNKVPVAARGALWEEAKPYYLETIDRDATSDNRIFVFEEYVNNRHQHLLYIWQSC